MSAIILSTAYFPPIPWMALALQNNDVTLNVHEHYVKQTWRNRCVIITANGLMNLVVPVQKYRNHTPVRDICVDYATNWQRVHEHAVRSAYGKSPYFEFYADRVLPLFSKRPKFLIELNLITIHTAAGIIKANLSLKESSHHLSPVENEINWQERLVPGAKESDLPRTSHYHQVFEDRHSFVSNLSILDLIFCAGPEAKDILVNTM